MYVVLFALNPAPPELSAAVPAKLDGPVPAEKFVPSAGEVTDAVIGGLWSSVKVDDAGGDCRLDDVSTACDRTVY